jgi:UTP--glucose-1-phosphate uridylyltransferase
MNVRKAVVLAAGWGTRMLPATKTVPKEMLAVVDRPVIHYILDEIVAAGLETMIIVTSQGKQAIEAYFDRVAELERLLETRPDRAPLQLVQAPQEAVRVAFVRQKHQLGIGHAVLEVEPFVRGEPFALFLPDDIIVGGEGPAIGELMEVYQRKGTSVVAVERVPPEQVRRYGIVAVEPVEPRVYRARSLVEKPEPQDAPSDLGIVGRYVLTPAVFAALRHTPPGAGGEIQITDALQVLAQGEGVHACEFTGERYDTGNPAGLIRAAVSIGLKRPDLAPALREFLKGLAC